MEQCMIYLEAGEHVPGRCDGDYIYPAFPFQWNNLISSLITVEKGGSWGLMDITEELQGREQSLSYEIKKGRLAVPFCYEKVQTPCWEMFPAKQGGRWGVVNLKGEIILPFAYQWVEIGCWLDERECLSMDFSRCSYAAKDGRIILFDPQFNPVWEDLTVPPAVYSKGNGYLLVQKGRKFGVVAPDGRPITNLTMLKREAVSLINTLCQKQ